MGGQNIHLIQILFVIAFLALSGLGWVIRKAQEQAEKKRIQADRQRRLEEMLRTGRDPTVEQATAMAQASAADRARLEEVARRRQAQMEQLRREQAQRRQESQRGDRRGDTTVPPIIIMGPSGPIALPRGGTSPGGGPMSGNGPSRYPASPTRPQKPQQRPARPAGQGKPQRKQERQPARPVPPAAPLPEPQPAAASRPAVVPGGRVGRRSMIVLPPIRPATGPEQGERSDARSRQAEYRRLIAMMEVMRPPLALREEEEPGPVYRAF